MIRLAIILFISTLPISNQSISECNSLKTGVFEIYENDSKIGLIYRTQGYQLEKYFGSESYTLGKIRNEQCKYYLKSYKVVEDLDTITWSIVYNKIDINRYSFIGRPIYLKSDYKYYGEIAKISDHVDNHILEIINKMKKE